jgi:hypothetical protein
VSDGADGWLTISPIDPEAIPDVVAAMVAAGGRVHAVDAGRSTLEDLFMRLVGGTAGDALGVGADTPGARADTRGARADPGAHS